MLRLEHLRKRYRGGVVANDDITLSVAEGEIHGLLGHNGAGKTTLVRQVAGVLRPTSGTIRLAGGDPVADPDFARRTCSVQPQSQVPLMGLSPRQAIAMIARIRGAGRREARARTGAMLAALAIERWADVPGDRLSGGVRRLTAFAMAAAAPGRLVILDEPTNDVDPARRRLLWGQVRALAGAGHAVLVVTHNVAEIERVVDRVTILAAGRVAASGTPAAIAVAPGEPLEDAYLRLAGDDGAEADDVLAA